MKGKYNVTLLQLYRIKLDVSDMLDSLCAGCLKGALLFKINVEIEECRREILSLDKFVKSQKIQVYEKKAFLKRRKNYSDKIHELAIERNLLQAQGAFAFEGDDGNPLLSIFEQKHNELLSLREEYYL